MQPTSPTLDVIPLPDLVIDRVGFDPRSPYAERFWLGVLGPTSLLLMRHLAAHFDLHPDGFELDRERAAQALGVGTRDGRNSPFVRAIARCGQFKLLQRPGPNILSVRRKMPPLTQAQVRRLPDDLQRAHTRWQEAQLGRPVPTDDEDRVRRLAATLLDVGESPAAVRSHLER
ncbi:MAG TPA: hypothetical protein VMW08_15700, partial [Acidimicrobiales bacterium]|nr:hypothetical protein [Acidimicrobiales bacterium]